MNFLEIAKQLPNGWRLSPMKSGRWVCRTTHNNPGKGRYNATGETKEEAVEKMVLLLKRENVI